MSQDQTGSSGQESNNSLMKSSRWESGYNSRNRITEVWGMNRKSWWVWVAGWSFFSLAPNHDVFLKATVEKESCVCLCVCVCVFFRTGEGTITGGFQVSGSFSPWERKMSQMQQSDEYGLCSKRVRSELRFSSTSALNRHWFSQSVPPDELI